MVRTAWLRRTASYGVAAIMACFGLTSVVSAQTITNTGPGSHNNITSNQTNDCQVMNNNNLSVYNRNDQSATTGNVTESGNAGVGLTWSGWDALNPTAAQASGQSYASWWSGVVNWIAQRAGGTGWNSRQSNLSWTPGSTDWTTYNPLLWQAQGQSFANWYNAAESYLNANSSNWVLSWPTEDTGSGSFGATSGNATNNYNANFSININNAARAAAGTNACGQSLFTPPTTGGSGGSGNGGGGVVLGSSFVPAGRPSGGSGGGGGGSGFFSGSTFIPTSNISRPAVSSPSVPNTTPVVSIPTGGSGGGGGGAPAPVPVASISNTGPGSSNNITSNQTNNSSVTNCNTVTVSSTNTQVATTGSSTVSGNTTAGGGGSGSATNAGSDGTGVGISN